MPVPDYQSLMLPTLKALSDGVETSISELRARIATAGGLTQEDVSEKLPSGRQTVFANRVGWALLGLDRAGLVQRVRRAVYRLTAEGGRLLAREPARVDDDVLRTYPAFVAWKDRERTHPPNIERPQPRDDDSKETPEETLDRAAGELRAMLEAEVLDRVRNAAPVFLERVVVDLLIAMGYGGGDAAMGRVTGRSGDGGIDGTIREDALGLDEGLSAGEEVRRWQRCGRRRPAQLRGRNRRCGHDQGRVRHHGWIHARREELRGAESEADRPDRRQRTGPPHGPAWGRRANACPSRDQADRRRLLRSGSHVGHALP